MVRFGHVRSASGMVGNGVYLAIGFLGLYTKNLIVYKKTLKPAKRVSGLDWSLFCFGTTAPLHSPVTRRSLSQEGVL